MKNQDKNREGHSRIAKGQNLTDTNDRIIADRPNSKTTGGKEQNTTNNACKEGSGASERVQYTKINVKDGSPSEAYSEKSALLSSASASSPMRSVHHKSGNIKSVNPAMYDSAGPAKRLFEVTSTKGPSAAAAAAATTGSSLDSAPNRDEVERNVKAIRESKSAGVTEDSSNTKEDMEVDEINSGLSPINPDAQESDNSLNDRKIKFGATTMERRSSKRQRTSASHRYSPGEGGGLASKKNKTINNGSGGAARSGNVSSKDAALKTQSSLAMSTVFSSTDGAGITGGKGDGKEDIDDKSRERKGENEGSKQESTPLEWSGPSYRWIDEGVRSDAAPSSVGHEGLEIDFTNIKTASWTPPPPFVVRPGDVLLLSSGGAPWDDVRQQKNNNAQGTSQKNQAKREVVPIYNDPASREPGLGALDPFIGYVERLWEEVDDPSRGKGSGQRKKKGKNNANAATTSAKALRMMIRTRWFFKKENVKGLKGNFVLEGGKNNRGGNAKEEILATMASQDLVLTNQSDDNVVSTILGKIKVVKRKPLDRPSEDIEMNDRKGIFVCRYDLSFCPVKSSGKEVMMVKLCPCADETENNVSLQTVAGDGANKRESKDVDSPDRTTSTDSDGYTSMGGNNYAAPLSSPFPLSPRRLVSEGGTTIGKIKIGPNHQAVIPAQLNLARKTSFRGLANPPSQRIPMMVWDPAADKDGSVDEFLDEARSLLCNHMKLIGLEPFHDVNYSTKAEAEKPREVNIDRLLTEFHECKGNSCRAIKKIYNNPEKYMTIWTEKDKELFDMGYRTYRDSIRMIVISLRSSKTFKDTVDYQYRFKLVENFRRFQMKKRVKAEEIMANVEDRMLNEKVKAEAKSQEAVETDVSEEEEGKVPLASSINRKVGSKLTAVPATHSGPVNNRVRTWFRTGGGDDDAVGATQQRRNNACDFLSQVRERVGKDAFATLAKSLKACNSSQATNDSLSEVQTAAKDVMKGHPDLLERFVTFLPKEVRSI